LSISRSRREIIGGVDTHAATHHAAVLDRNGARLGSKEFPATAAGYVSMLAWMRRFGVVTRVGVEGTGAYGAGLARYLHDQGVTVIEVPRPDRRVRRQSGKSDPIDAEAAARSVIAGTATVAPKLSNGPIEALRALRVARSGAIKAKTAATNTLHGMVITAPEALRSQLPARTGPALISACLRLRPDPERLADPTQATKTALRSIAQRAQALTLEARRLERQIAELTKTAAPNTTALFALGPDTASALLVTIGDNPDRLRSEASFAHLCGVAPIPASSGKTNRHRLHRGGNRTANRALHIAIIVRLRYHQPSRDYAARRRTEGLTMPEIIRCLKRYFAREVFSALRADYTALAT
jgi:transposase